MDENYKELLFRADTEDFLASLEDAYKRQIGFALWEAQVGKKAPAAKPLGGQKEFKGGKVLEIVTPGDGETYRTVYTIEFEEAIYVLDAFQKKSKRGAATPKEDIDRIVLRIKALRKERDEPEGKILVAKLLAEKAERQRFIDERRKQNEPK